MRILAIIILVLGTLGYSQEQTKIPINKPIRVAIIDTGKSFLEDTNLCGSIDLVGHSFNHVDINGHGTNVSSLIRDNAGDVNYCELPIRYDHIKKPMATSNTAFRLAITFPVDIINYSGGGTGIDSEECRTIKLALDRGIKVVAAAGNNGNNLAEEPYYPASCDERVIVVGCSNLESSNYGKVDFTYKCKQVGSPPMSGTSQATAIHTGKLIQKIYKERLNESRKNRKSK